MKLQLFFIIVLLFMIVFKSLFMLLFINVMLLMDVLKNLDALLGKGNDSELKSRVKALKWFISYISMCYRGSEI